MLCLVYEAVDIIDLYLMRMTLAMLCLGYEAVNMIDLYLMRISSRGCDDWQ